MPRAARPRPRLRLLITAGPTREHLDDVRFLSNGSTGRLGLALAAAARRAGLDVTLLLGPVEAAPPAGVRVVPVVSTADLLRAAERAAPAVDAIVFAAAPADWRPARRRAGKPAKGDGPRTLRLLPTPDVAAALARTKGRRVHVGFALESAALPAARAVARARAKLRRKRFDAIVLNTPANLGRGGGYAAWVGAQAAPAPLPTRSKDALAHAVLRRLLALLAPAEGASRD